MSLNVSIKNSFNTALRLVNGLKRPSKQQNLALLRKRGETLDSLLIRDAYVEDIHNLAVLHAKTWNETYSGKGPTASVREQQWREVFKKPSDDWFMLVIENRAKELIGFAYGKSYNHGDLPSYSGELNKIYVLREYQRIGLGRKLITHAAQKFLSMGIHSMVLFGIPQNPSCYFHEALGGKRLNSEKEVFQGGYAWSDLRKLV